MASDERRLYFPSAYAARDGVGVALDTLLILSKFWFIVSNKRVKALKKRFDSEMGYQETEFGSQKDLLDEIMNLVYKVFRKKIGWLLIPKYFFIIEQNNDLFDGVKYLSDTYSREYHRDVLFKALRSSGIGITH